MEIQQELAENCQTIIDQVEQTCMEVAQSDESKAFFYKMIGDYYRYIAECTSSNSEDHQTVKNGANENYQLAQTMSENLSPCNNIKLGLALNFSVFNYEVMNNHKQACEIAD